MTNEDSKVDINSILQTIKENLNNKYKELPEPFHRNTCLKEINSTRITHITAQEHLKSCIEKLEQLAKSSSTSSIVAEFNKTVQNPKDKLDINNESDKTSIQIMYDYRNLEIEYYTTILGYAYAHEIHKKLQSIQSSLPNNECELIILKRHEVCSNTTKSFGFAIDADLDACTSYRVFNPQQTKSELYATKRTQTLFKKFLEKLYGNCIHSDIKVSPVSRAISTLKEAYFELGEVSSITVDADLSEKQYPTTIVASGRASKKPSFYVEQFKQEGFKGPINSGNDTIPEGETSLQFSQRLKRAVILVEAAKKAAHHSHLKLNVCVGHGAMNKHIITELFKKYCIQDPINQLEFGDQYILVGVRDKESGELENMKYLGIYNHFGYKREFHTQTDKHFIELMGLKDPSCFDAYIKNNKNYLLDNLSKLVLSNKCEHEKIELLLKTLLQYQLSEIMTRPDNTHSTNYSDKKKETIFTQIQNSSLMVYSSAINYLSGKAPEAQQVILSELKDIIENNYCFASLITLQESASKKLSKGKVTHLINAFAEFKKLSEPVAYCEQKP